MQLGGMNPPVPRVGNRLEPQRSAGAPATAKVSWRYNCIDFVTASVASSSITVARHLNAFPSGEKSGSYIPKLEAVQSILDFLFVSYVWAEMFQETPTLQMLANES